MGNCCAGQSTVPPQEDMAHYKEKEKEITKIQAAMRGKAARKQINENKDKSNK